MRRSFALAGGIATLIAAIAAGAASPYDGSYVGASATFNGTTGGGKGAACTQFATPAPVTIANGHAKGKWGDSSMEGDVTPDGRVVMRTPAGGVFHGQIDANGVFKGSYSSYCTYALTWQRRG